MQPRDGCRLVTSHHRPRRRPGDRRAASPYDLLRFLVDGRAIAELTWCTTPATPIWLAVGLRVRLESLPPSLYVVSLPPYWDRLGNRKPLRERGRQEENLLERVTDVRYPSSLAKSKYAVVISSNEEKCGTLTQTKHGKYIPLTEGPASYPRYT